MTFTYSQSFSITRTLIVLITCTSFNPSITVGCHEYRAYLDDKYNNLHLGVDLANTG